MKRILASLALLCAPVTVYADGMFPNLPAATLPLSGIETIPVDTHLSQGRVPQSVSLMVSQIKDYVFGNTASGTATASAGLAVVNTGRGIVTTEGLTTPAGTIYNLSINNSTVTTNSIVLVSVGNGTNTVVGPTLAGVRTAPGAFYIDIRNTHATDPFNGTLLVSFIVIN